MLADREDQGVQADLELGARHVDRDLSAGGVAFAAVPVRVQTSPARAPTSRRRPTGRASSTIISMPSSPDGGLSGSAGIWSMAGGMSETD